MSEYSKPVDLRGIGQWRLICAEVLFVCGTLFTGLAWFGVIPARFEYLGNSFAWLQSSLLWLWIRQCYRLSRSSTPG